MPAKTDSRAIQKIEPDEEMDNLSLKLTKDEMRVLALMLSNQRAYTIGELQRNVNGITLKGKGIAWRKMENIIETLMHYDLIRTEELPNDDKRAKSRIHLEPAFATRWRNRRLMMLRVCQDFPKARPIDVLGETLAYFYNIKAPDKENLQPITSFSRA